MLTGKTTTGNLTAQYAMDGNNVAFTVTVTNNNNITLSTANKAAGTRACL